MKRSLSFLLVLSLVFLSTPQIIKADEFVSSPSPIICEAFVSNLMGTNGSSFQHYSRARFNDQIVLLNFHVSDQLSTTENLDRQIRVYNSKTYPLVYVNGTVLIRGSVDYEYEIEKVIKKLNYSAKIKIIQQENQLIVNVKTDKKMNNVNMVVLLYEDEVFTLVNNLEKDIFHRYVIRKIVSATTGDPMIIQADLVVSKKYKLTTKLTRQMGFVAFLQDPNTKEIYGTAHERVNEHTPTILHWNNYDSSLIGFDNITDKQFVMTHTGYDYMTFRADKPKRIKSINMQIETYNDYFSLRYIVPTVPNSKITFSKTSGNITIEYPEEINSEETVDLFKLVVRFTKITKDGTAESFLVTKLYVNGADGNPSGWEYIELKKYCYNQLVVLPNPLDINKDFIVDKNDVKEVIDEFGRLAKDNLFETKFDVNNDSRVDIQDIILVERETWIYDPPKN